MVKSRYPDNDIYLRNLSRHLRRNKTHNPKENHEKIRINVTLWHDEEKQNKPGYKCILIYKIIALNVFCDLY